MKNIKNGRNTKRGQGTTKERQTENKRRKIKGALEKTKNDRNRVIQERIKMTVTNDRKDKPTPYAKKCRKTRKTGQHRHVKRQEKPQNQRLEHKARKKGRQKKNKGQKHIHNVGRLQNLGFFLNFQDRGGLKIWDLPWIFRVRRAGNLGSFLNFQDRGGLGTLDLS